MIRNRRGFTLVELLVTTIILGIVVGGLHEAHVRQRRFTVWQQRVADTHDGFRIANSLLAADFREAVIPDGDVILLSRDSIEVRSPHGFGVVCDVRGSPATIRLSHTIGWIPEARGDSLLIYTTRGWRGVAVVRAERAGRCPSGSRVAGPTLRLESGATDSVEVGAPIRAFQRHRYHRVQEGGETWLARTDQDGSELVVGPLTSDGLRFALLDAAGRPTRVADDAAGVRVELIMTSTGPAGQRSLDTLDMVFQGRNR